MDTISNQSYNNQTDEGTRYFISVMRMSCCSEDGTDCLMLFIHCTRIVRFGFNMITKMRL